jgi:predicted dinucleotide-binding enzyme
MISFKLKPEKMKIGVLGTGTVGKTIGSKLIQLGHDVKMGSRTAGNEKAVEWVKASGPRASEGTFAQAAASSELFIFNCTSGMNSLSALKDAGKQNMEGKILIDLANPLDFSKGMPPTLSICNDDSLGETIQREFPDTKVVKTLNTLNCNLMVNPAKLNGQHSIFISGNDEKAKARVRELLTNWFGWKSVIDLGDITHSAWNGNDAPGLDKADGCFGDPQF